MAIWVGGDEQIFNRHKPVLDAMGDQAAYIGPIARQRGDGRGAGRGLYDGDQGGVEPHDADKQR